MSKSTLYYPSLSVDTTGGGVVSQAGAITLLRTAEKTGLTARLSAALSPWRKPLATHDSGKIVLDLAVAVALGGDCLADVALLREEPGVFGSVASDPTVSRLFTTLAADAPTALRAINTARAAARQIAWAHAGEHAPDHDISAKNPLIIDLDATLVTAHSEKEHAAPTYKKGFGHHPFCAFVDHGQAGTFSPSRSLRVVCSGVCRRLAMIVKSSYAHPRASDSHKHWHHLQGPSQPLSISTHHRDATQSAQQQTYPIVPNSDRKITYDTRH